MTLNERILEELKKTNALLQQQLNEHAAWIQRVQEREEMLDSRDEAWKAEMRASYEQHNKIEQERLALDTAAHARLTAEAEEVKAFAERSLAENLRYARERDGAMMALAMASDKYSVHAFTENKKPE